MARTVEAVMAIVRKTARALMNADGATFVLRDNGFCYYADEDAVSSLWKGKRFPLGSCISGWAMLHREPVVIADIYQDPRIPLDAYRVTFVKSLAMVPIRTREPIGAIGAYWAHHRSPHAEEVRLLQALADSTSIALENVELYADLERRVEERTRELAQANRDLELFAATAAHDLRGPLTAIRLGCEALLMDEEIPLVSHQTELVRDLIHSSDAMRDILNGLQALSQVSRRELREEEVDLTAMARGIERGLRGREPHRTAEIVVEDGLVATADPTLLRVALENLLSNAWKYSAKQPHARIVVGQTETERGRAFFVRDNGAGFDAARAADLFTPFRRLHSSDEFPGTGLGLVTVARVVGRHGGDVWGEGAVGQGATFFLQLSRPAAASPLAAAVAGGPPTRE